MNIKKSKLHDFRERKKSIPEGFKISRLPKMKGNSPNNFPSIYQERALDYEYAQLGKLFISN